MPGPGRFVETGRLLVASVCSSSPNAVHRVLELPWSMARM
jgi:hypothetical protein